MEELRLFVEIEGFDRVPYKTSATWDNCSLSIIDNGKGTVEVWETYINNKEAADTTIILLKEQIERLILSFEWSFGCELKYKIKDINAPSFVTEEQRLKLVERVEMKDKVENTVAPRNPPTLMPEVPVEAKRWIKAWVECNNLSDYVEEQLRRQYLIIEELWQELRHEFDNTENLEKKNVKLIRDFVSHASCDNQDIVSLVEKGLPSAVQCKNGKKQVSFNRTDVHRNYISRFEVKSRKIARTLVNHKMKQLGTIISV